MKEHSLDRPPTEFGLDIDLRLLTTEPVPIYWGFFESEPDAYFWHWCAPRNRWCGAGTWSHTLVSKDPLHLEPSLLWECCGLHGFVRDGKWVNC